MSGWIVAIFVLVGVAAFVGLRMASQAEQKGTAITRKAEVGAGVIALGVLLLFMPAAAGSIAALDFIKSDAFAILVGATYVLGFLVVLAGIAVIVMKETE